MVGYSIEINGFVPAILSYENGKVFCNFGTGCEAFNSETGEILKTWTTTVDNEEWAPPPEFDIQALGFRLRQL